MMSPLWLVSKMYAKQEKIDRYAVVLLAVVTVKLSIRRWAVKGSIAAHGPRHQVDLVQRIGDKATNPMPQIFSVDSVWQQRRFLLTRALSCMCSVCLFLCLVALLHTVRL